MAAIASIYRSRTVCAVFGQISEEILHWNVTAVAGTGATDQQIADALDAFMGPITKPLVTVNASYRGVGVQRILPLPQPVERFGTGQAGPCTAAGTQIPMQSSGLITLRSDLAGRSNRGRVYLPFPVDTFVTASGIPTAGYLTLLNAYATTILTPFVAGVGGNTNNLQLIIFSRKLATKQTVTSFRPIAAFATQRRRGTLGRPNPIPF